MSCPKSVERENGFPVRPELSELRVRFKVEEGVVFVCS
jgi:hypothetical protein